MSKTYQKLKPIDSGVKFQDHQFDPRLGHAKTSAYYDTTRSGAVTISDQIAREIKKERLQEKIAEILSNEPIN